MPGTFTIEWLPGGVLLQQRSGMLTAEQAHDYVAAVELAVAQRPSPWGIVVDTRDASAQSEEVQSIIRHLIPFVVSHDVKRVALVSSSVVTGLQQRRLTVDQGMHDPSAVGYFTDFEEAVSDVRRHLLD